MIVSGLLFPLTMLHYFWKALERRNDIELFVTGPFFGDSIPWNYGMKLPQKYVKYPDLPLPQQSAGMMVDPVLIEVQLPENMKNPDLWLEIDAGWHLSKRPTAGVVALIETDPHCVTGDTMLYGENGFLYVNEVASSHLTRLYSRNGIQHNNGVFQTKLAPVMTIELENGITLSCTDDHLIETSRGFIPAADLLIGDSVLSKYGSLSHTTNPISEEYALGFVLGCFKGDGSFGREGFVKFTFGKQKRDLGEQLKNYLLKCGIDTVSEYKHKNGNGTFVLQVRRWGFYKFLKSIGIKSDGIPFYIRNADMNLIAGYVAGLFSCDGCSSDGRIQITAKDKKTLKELQLILQAVGVGTRIKHILSNNSAYKPGEKYGTLYVNSASNINFASFVSELSGKAIKINGLKFVDGSSFVKESKITNIYGKVKSYPEKRFCEPVYDVFNSSDGTFLANGISVHNCLKGNYQLPKSYSDVVFTMQTPYIEAGEQYLPYAYDPTIHYPEPETEKIYDACLIGLHYPQRDALVSGLRNKGYNVHYSIGEIYDDYRHIYNQSKIALSWSTLLDMPARVWEAFGMGNLLVTNRVPDLPTFFTENDHYLGFSTVEEGISKVEWALANWDEAQKIADAGHRKVNGNTYDARVRQILETCKLR